MNWKFWKRVLGEPTEDGSVTVDKPFEINVDVVPGETIIFTYKLTVSSDDVIQDREAIRASCLHKAERAVNRFIDGIKIIEGVS